MKIKMLQDYRGEETRGISFLADEIIDEQLTDDEKQVLIDDERAELIEEIKRAKKVKYDKDE